ncbi:MAG: cyclic pyranopterin monophosphate synthase MoaC [Candidatus Humimicrobiaceae bacterium]
MKGGNIKKGNVLAASRIAGIMAAKKTWEIIPLCHQIKLAGIDIEFRINKDKNNIEVISTVEGFDKTGVEMEALAAVSVALLNIYDMCKALSRNLEISQIRLLENTGGTHAR